MNTALRTLRHWSWLKKSMFLIAAFTFLTSSFLFLTPPGGQIREWLAQTVITTQHRSWAWIFVGAEQRDIMVQRMQTSIEEAAMEKQDMNMVKYKATHRKARSIDELIKVEDISGQFWKGKKMTVYDPTTIRVMTPSHSGEGEKISSMVTRTGAVAGVNGGGFDDPEGLGNGFAAIGAILSGGEVVYTDQDGSIPQHIVGFTKDGTLVVGKYNIFELRDMGISEGVSFYPRLIANGKPLITSGDGGWGRGPRTAVGQKADGTVIFIVIDGRQAHSVGATLKEVQDLFLEDGVVNAGNLDGGASSELVVDGQVVTKPSSRYGERRLPSAFLVYDKPELVKANHVWDGIDKIDAGGSYDHPDFLREQAELKAKQKSNPPPAAPKTETKTDTKTETKTEPKSTETKTTEPKGDVKTDTGKTGSADPGTGAAHPPAGTGAGKEPAAGPGGAGEPGKTQGTGAAVPGSGSPPAPGGAAVPQGSTPPAAGGPTAGGAGQTAPSAGSGSSPATTTPPAKQTDTTSAAHESVNNGTPPAAGQAQGTVKTP
ncbi:phosphodiester glycosidase family protein [Paenibacillus filicis]|uniref:Phosphodiester glycosidase family protein n=1 Tax=Paenibacillus gyeongsangnamensis TaxID=3388067 RepID=A0ABT4Q900_9BACL|nr:phosphodiester glycosidase family protein [Paenibacillus filicis]MCZ8513335.1 phosphodiester glycosidase family protein [Paenibacillus filicis]